MTQFAKETLPISLEEEMRRSYLDYAMSVIVGRALPDVRDGLKPVHRRVIYAMYDGGYRPDKGFNKCTRVVGEVMGQFHPHGDASIYDALVRLVQPWSLRYPLALGQGNFGSAGNDGAAAPRYTETKMAPLAMEMVRDIELSDGQRDLYETVRLSMHQRVRDEMEAATSSRCPIQLQVEGVLKGARGDETGRDVD